ncbi:MAG: hypothetical protein E6J20_13115 [Chloroflexi bacterium]|nr:MAG: hypothetical protein E6J20_13115 [Chloroflexota bacterium]
MHFTANPPFAVPLPCSSLAGWNEIDEDSGNGVFHFAGNANGFWVTGTYEGDIQIHPVIPTAFDSMGNPTAWVPDTLSGRPSAQGHVADWFGESFNLKNVVLHDAVNAQVTTSSGQAITFHMVDHIQATPPTPTSPPVITHQFQNVSCS